MIFEYYYPFKIISQQNLQQNMTEYKRHSILGVGVNAINLSETINLIEHWIQNHSSKYVCLAPAHSIMSCYDNPDLYKIYNNSGLTVPDGMAIVWILQLAGWKNVGRVYGPDLLLSLCQQSARKKHRHYFYGGNEPSLLSLIDTLNHHFPGMIIAGFESPPFRDLSMIEKEGVINRIQKVKADIVWIGLGSPKQEIWMSENANLLKGAVLIGVGAAFDFISGMKPQAPRWVQRIGMEWFFRFLSEPSRLWRRYIINYPRFVLLVFLQYLGILKIQAISKD